MSSTKNDLFRGVLCTAENEAQLRMLYAMDMLEVNATTNSYKLGWLKPIDAPDKNYGLLMYRIKRE